MTLVNAFCTLLFLFPLSISFATQFLIQGSIIEDSGDNINKSRLIYMSSIFIGIVTTAILVALTNQLPEYIIGFYIEEGKTKDLAVEVLVIYSYVFIADSMHCILFGIIKGMGIESIVFW